MMIPEVEIRFVGGYNHTCVLSDHGNILATPNIRASVVVLVTDFTSVHTLKGFLDRLAQLV
jgi:hypothetical protein